MSTYYYYYTYYNYTIIIKNNPLWTSGLPFPAVNVIQIVFYNQFTIIYRAVNVHKLVVFWRREAPGTDEYASSNDIDVCEQSGDQLSLLYSSRK